MDPRFSSNIGFAEPTKNPKAGRKISIHPPIKQQRETDVLPFQIPHKKLLEKIEFKKEPPEPLTGFKVRQERLLYGRREHSVYTKSFIREKKDKPRVRISEVAIYSDVHKTPTTSGGKVVLPHHKLKDVVDQSEVIVNMRQVADGSFIYFTFAVPRSSEHYTPYALRQVPYSKVDKRNYLTMSNKGVLQHIGTEMIFTTLDDWEAEYEMYCRLMRIKTFFHFRMWKGFYVWRKVIIYTKYSNAQKHLMENLYILNPILRTGLLDIQLMCYKMLDTSFMDTSNIENRMLFYFIEDQMARIEIIDSKIVMFRSVAREVISNACHGALLQKGFVLDERILIEEAKEQRKKGHRGYKTSYIEQASKKKFCRRLSNYIVLMDYLMVGMLHRLITNSLKEIINTLEKHIKYLPPLEEFDKIKINTPVEYPRAETGPQNPFLIIEVVLEENYMTLDPSLEVTVNIIKQIYQLWIKTISQITSFVGDPFFTLFVNPIINGKIEERLVGYGPPLMFFIEDNIELKEMKEYFMETIAMNWELGVKYISKLEFLREFYAEDLQLDEKSIENETSLDRFRQLCIRFMKEIEIVKELKDSVMLGALNLQFVNVKKYALPESVRLLNLVHQVLPLLGREKVNKLKNDVEAADEFLQLEPVTTKDFVKYLEYIEQAPEMMDNMEEILEYCKDLYDITEEFKMMAAQDDISNYLGVSVNVGNLRNLVDKKADEVGNITQDFSKQLNKDIGALISRIGVVKDECMQPWLLDIDSNVSEVMEVLTDLNNVLSECQTAANQFKSFQKQFRMEVTRFDVLDEVMNDVKLRTLLWESVESWAKTIDTWYHADFSTLDVEEMNLFTLKNVKNINQFEKGLPSNLIVPKLKDDVELMKDKLPVITHLRNPNLRPRHWVKIENILNYKFKADEAVTLELLEVLKVFNYPDEFQEISAQASSEAGLESLLRRVEESWKTLEFIVLPHKDQKDVFIFGSMEEVQTTLDESTININTIASSKHVGPIKNRVDEWQRQLELFTKTMDEWSLCQQSWIYLEVIFSAPDIQRQLPNESKLFIMVDKSWKEIMRRTAKIALALEAALYPGLLEILEKNNTLLEQIMKCLESYLETKRVAFPRFYFLSNDELLEILAQTRNPHAVQPHLRKCFDAIAKLEFGMKEAEETEDKKKGAQPEMILTTDIMAMISPQGERVALSKGLKARGNVEDWLGKVEESMFISLRKLMRAALNDFQMRERVEWVLLHAHQITMTISRVMWAKGVHEVLDIPGPSVTKRMDGYKKKCIQALNDLAGIIRTADLDPVRRITIVALITVDVHARDIVDDIVKSGIQDNTGFDWLKNLRFYWDDSIDDCVTRMSNAQYLYGYEYLGATNSLVVTPLTDKCYLCLMGALQLDLGGSAAGPAGTGKTETTKDLSKAVAVQCVVFNCSEGLDYKIMGRFFAGLAQSGAWCCFDEFNRIDIEVLSVIAQQLITIRNAKAAKLQRFMFEGREIKLVMRCATFITMNPGYAGRTELPDNLKALFRPITMMVPDYALIAEVTLYSLGFENSQVLSKKMVNMYKLCSEQLSQQDHYDFGMRAVKSVLTMAGSLKSASPDKDEAVLLLLALKNSNLPKFLTEDAILFGGILGDLFPGVELPVEDYGRFQEGMVESMLEEGLQPEDKMIYKVVQLYETMVVRLGVMLVGPTGGGKSTILRILAKAQEKMFYEKVEGPFFRRVRTYIMNPKAVTAGELYGEVNPMTLEWRDGLMGIMMRTAVRDTTDDMQWIICDGPVDAVWIENMNTVLDDNKMLCLANSERIKLTPYVHMLFEVQDLSHASPATVSRCGMVYVNSEDLKWMPYVKSWLQRIDEKILTPEMKEFMVSLFEFSVEAGFVFIKKNCSYSIHQVEISKAVMMCSLIESFLKIPGAMDKIGEKSKVRNFLCQTFIFAYLWAVGGNLYIDSMGKIETFIQEQFEEHADARIPPGVDLWEVYMDVQKKRLEKWNTLIPPFVYDKEEPFFECIVPTVDTVRFGYIVERLIYVDKPVILTGDTGVGKTIVAKDVLNRLFATGLFVPVTMNFSAQTNSFRTQEIMELKLERKKKTLLGAPIGKKVVMFVDDVNMPKLEVYGAQPPIELLRQFLDYGGLYDREKLFWKTIQDVVITAACAPPGGGRNPLTPRFIRHFAMLLIPPPSEFSLKAIFKAILKGFLRDFANEVRDMGDSMVNAAVDIYDRIATDLLPTPTKSHYVFNLRDLSKCIQGLTQADPGTLRTKPQMHRLFYHECLRVFHDRLINVQDKSYFYLLMKEVCSRNFSTAVLDLPEGEVIKNPPVLLFGDFLQMGANKQDRVYEEYTNVEKVKLILKEYLDDYNMGTSKEMHLIFFMVAVEHCLRIARILRTERGNALLIGVGGMGKQSLTKLATHLNEYKSFQIELTRNYDHESFFEDLRKVYKRAGAQFEDIVFLFTDTQIVQEEFLEDINNILNSGDVPNLFEAEELEFAINSVRELAKQSGITNRDGIYDYFIRRTRSKMHLVICMSPVGDAFRRRCRMFPSLVNCCTIDWFEGWPREALLSVAQNTLTSIKNPDLINSLSEICVTMHESVEKMTERFYNEVKRYYYTTPSSYLELLKLYFILLEAKKEKVGKMRDRIANGLQKIYETNEVIDSMKETLIALEPILVKKNADADKLMIHLEKEQKAADKVRNVVKGDEEIAKVKADETQAIADDAQKDLDTALPALDAAEKALKALNKNDINELKVFQKPPKLVQFVMEAICLVLGAKPTWDAAKKVLGDVNFLKRLEDYDKDNVSDATLKKLKSYVENSDFVPEKVATVSKACKSMCMWVKAIDMYAKVVRVVEPKRKRLQEAEVELNKVMGVLRTKQKQLADVESMIAQLEDTFNKTLAEKKELEDNIQLTAARLNRAGRLNIALEDEQLRWEESVKEMGIILDNAFGDVLMAAGCVAYMGAFTDNYRAELIDLWEGDCRRFKIPATAKFSLIDVLADAYEVRVWNAAGLPKDTVSTENAILVTRGRRWPLMIDPQEQAVRWIKKLEGQNSLQVIKLTDGHFMKILEQAVRLGFPVLLEEVGEVLDPTLETILLKQTFVVGGRLLIRIGDSDVEYDKNFKFYITTKLANPHYLPEICIKVTIVNFTVTPSGLEDQLLADVVSIERPDLEQMRNELVVRINADKGSLLNIEDKILHLLYNSQGNILDDEELIETLNESKETSSIIAARLSETESTEEKISTTREKYRSVATRGSVLYFVVAGLAEIDPMYQYSLKYFTQIFSSVIATSAKSNDLEVRLATLYREITLAVYTNVSRGLFERHKLVFSFLLCSSIFKQAGIISDLQWNYLLRGPAGSNITPPPKPDTAQITDAMWIGINWLTSIYKLFGFNEDVTNDFKLQIGEFALDISLGGGGQKAQRNWDESLDDFEKLMIIKTIKEEKLVFAITEYVKIKLGQVYIESPQASLNVLYQDTSNSIPLIFVLSTGSDPFGAFQRFAVEMRMEKKIKSISLGQGQGPVAERMIKEAVETGDWVFLQNCHLATSWMLAMERIIIKIAEDSKNVHKNFRLYLSSMPNKAFPVSVLQNSVKVTNEPPKGLRANVRRAFLEIPPPFFEDNVLGMNWKKMIFGICMFHGIIQERKKFGPLGWNIVYEFNDSDREFAFNTMEMYCERGTIPWDALEYLTGEITYGGRVTDYWDLRCLKTILKIFFSPQILKPGYVYSKSGVYYCPSFKTIQEYHTFVESLPLIEDPDIFGMHENANLAYQIKETQVIIKTIIESQPRAVSGTKGKSSDEIVYELADSISEQIIEHISTEEANVFLFKRDDKGRMPSLTTVLLQEVDRYNKLLKLIHSTLGNLKKAIKGFVVMSEELEQVFIAFINNAVPNLWSSRSYNSLKSLGSWVHDLVMRLDFICIWVRYGGPVSYWLSGFYFPQGFLTGTLQTHARKYNLPINDLKYDFTAVKLYLDQEDIYKGHKATGKDGDDLYSFLDSPEDGVLIHGLFMDAGKWDRSRRLLINEKPGEVNPPMAVIHMLPKKTLPANDPRYHAPLYKTSVRAGTLSTTGHSTNFVIAVFLPSKEDPSYWILRGTALLTQITD